MSLFRTDQDLDYPVQEVAVGVGTAPGTYSAQFAILMKSVVSADQLTTDQTNGLYSAIESYFDGLDWSYLGEGNSVQYFYVYEFDETQNNITPG
jgi:hypothetical protein